MKSYKVKFSGKIYKQALEEGWLNSLAIYLLIIKKHSGKSFYFKKNQKTKMLRSLSMKTGVGVTSLSKHLNILQEKGMAKFHSDKLVLMSNSEMKIGRYNTMFIKANINSLSDIKFVLKTIPVLNNFKKQSKKIKKKEHCPFTCNKMEKDMQSGGTYKSLINKRLMLGLKRFGQVINKKSDSTICKYKKRMKQLGLIDYVNSWRTIQEGVPYTDYIEMKSMHMIRKNVFWYKGTFYSNNPSVFTVTY